MTDAQEHARLWVSMWIGSWRRGDPAEPSRDALVQACRAAGIEPPDADEPMKTWGLFATPPVPGVYWERVR